MRGGWVWRDGEMKDIDGYVESLTGEDGVHDWDVLVSQVCRRGKRYDQDA